MIFPLWNTSLNLLPSGLEMMKRWEFSVFIQRLEQLNPTLLESKYYTQFCIPSMQFLDVTFLDS